MTEQVQERELKLYDEDWIKISMARFTPIYQANRRLDRFCSEVLSELARCIEMPYAVLYRRVRFDGVDSLARCGCYAADRPPERLALGDGATGQAALEARVLQLCPLPQGHVRVASALGE